MVTTNWHTHTYRCKHAEGDVADYCRAAGQAGLAILGFSDHTPLPDNRWPSVRMGLDGLPDYVAALDAARKAFPHLQIMGGLECEFAPEYVGFYRDELLGKFGLDYLVGGAHWYPYEGNWTGMYGVPMTAPMLHAYTDYLIDSMRSGLFTFIAHPDLFGNAYPTWDAEAHACSRAVATAAAELGVPLEINAYGLRKPMIETPNGTRHRYPWLPFWETVAACGARVVVSSDAHEPQNVAGDMEAAAAIAARFGLVPLDDPRGAHTPQPAT